MEFPRARLENRVHIAAAVAALAGVIERGLDLELLNDVRIGERDVGGLRHVVVSRADAFDQVVVVVLALAIDNYANIAAAKLGGGVQIALRPGRQGEQLFEVLGCQGKLADRGRIDSLARGGAGGFDLLHFGLDFNLLEHPERCYSGAHPGGLGHTHADVGELPFLEAGAAHRNGVGPGGQQRSGERAVGIGLRGTRHNAGVLVNDADLCVGHHGACGILHRSRDCPRGTALRKGQRRQEPSQQHQENRIFPRPGHTLLPVCRPFLEHDSHLGYGIRTKNRKAQNSLRDWLER